MNNMSSNIERVIATKLNTLGSNGTVSFYRHNKADEAKYKLHPGEHDCISCTKHLTHKIPNNSRCEAICGIPLHTELKRRVSLVKDKSKVTKEEIRDILAMSRLIEQTEQQT